MELIKLHVFLMIIYSSVSSSWGQPSEMYISTGSEIIQLLQVTSDRPLNGNRYIARTLLNGLEEVQVLDVDRHNNIVYWVDTVLRTINRVNASANNTQQHDDYQTLIRDDILMPSCVAVDWVAGNIFFTDSMRKRIEVATVQGQHRKALIYQDLTAPTSIALDVYSGYMFWIDNSSNPVIERAAFDGSDRLTIISEGLVNPLALAIDYNSNGVPLLFWINTVAGLRVIEYSNFDGSGRNQLRKWDITYYRSSLSVSGDEIFWTINDTIHQFNKATNVTQTFYRTNKTLCDLNAPPTFHPTVASPCASESRNGCGHLCLTLPPGNRSTCACSTGLKIRSDAKRCQSYPNRVLFTTHDREIRYVSLDIADEYIDISTNIHTSFTRNVDSVKFGVGHMIYWTETASNLSQTSFSSIRRSTLSGTPVETLVEFGLHTPRGLVIDNAGLNLYWIDGHFKRIEISRMNGSSRMILIDSNLTDPQSLAIDKSSRALIYWSDWGDNVSIPARIERAFFDGSNRTTVLTFDIGIVPVAITIDMSTSLLYWAASNGTIGRCDSRGEERQIVYVAATPSIDGITIVKDYLFWINKTAGSVWRANKTNASDAKLIIKGLTELRGISSIDTIVHAGGGYCQFDNNHCSHLCLSTDVAASCACPDGLALGGDRRVCIEPDSEIIAYSMSDGISIARQPTGCHAWYNQHLNVTTSDTMIAIDVEVLANRTYWIDQKHKTIYRTNNTEEAAMPIISSGLEEPSDLAVDWMGGNLYWTDKISGKIEVSKLDGSYRRVLFAGLNHPHLLEVNPILGVLYVVTGLGIIEQYQMDGHGGMIKSFRTYQDDTISAMEINYNTNDVFFKVDRGHRAYKLLRITSDFDHEQSIVDLQSVRPLDPFAVHKHWIYYIVKNHHISGIVTVHLGSRTLQCLNYQASFTRLYSTKVVHYDRQAGYHWCQVNNGDCDGLCLPQKYGRVCQCPAHQFYDHNSKKCKDVLDFIVFCNATGIYQLPMRGGSDATPQLLPLGQGEIHAVKYDSYTNELYWAQTFRAPGSAEGTLDGSIRRGKLDGSDQVIVQKVALINTNWFSMLLDQNGGHVFWTLSSGNQIEVVNTNGSGLAPLFIRTNLNPRGLAFNPDESVVYFANWWGSPQFSTIRQIHLNSNVTETLYVSPDPSNSTEKQGALLYDSNSHHLYWSDSKMKAVYRCSVNSLPCRNRSEVLHVLFHDSLSFAIDEDYIYWYNSSKQAIYRANKVDGSDRILFASGIVGVTDLTIGSRSNHVRRTRCTEERRPCSHLCIPDGNLHYQCACPYNWKMSDVDPNTCISTNCSENEVFCLDRSACVKNEWVCDGFSDCPDGSDESPEDCICHAHEFKCGNVLADGQPQCVPRDAVCNGDQNCLDESDETHCGCQEGFVECAHTLFRGDSKCIPRVWFCDQDPDCEIAGGVALDEFNCSYNMFTIPPGSSTDPQTDDPTDIVQPSYPAGQTVIVVVCTVMGGLIIVFLAFLVLSVCYFSYAQKTLGNYKFGSTTGTPETSSRFSSASETTPNSVSTQLTKLDCSIDGTSYNSFATKLHSESQSSLETAVTQAPYQPPNTPTTNNRSVRFTENGVLYRHRTESPVTVNDGFSYAGPCPSVAEEDTSSHITSVSEYASKREFYLLKRQEMMMRYYEEDYDTGSITSDDTKMSYNSTNCSTNFIDPPPPSLASHSMYMDGPPDDY